MGCCKRNVFLHLFSLLIVLSIYHLFKFHSYSWSIPYFISFHCVPIVKYVVLFCFSLGFSFKGVSRLLFFFILLNWEGVLDKFCIVWFPWVQGKEDLVLAEFLSLSCIDLLARLLFFLILWIPSPLKYLFILLYSLTVSYEIKVVVIV